MSFYSEYSARTPGSGSGGSGVSSLNSLTGALTLAAGTGISITPSGGNTLTIASTGGGSGTVTSVDMTVPAFLAISGNPITTSGTLALTLSGTALPVANGGTGATSFTTGSIPFMGASALTEDNSNLFWDNTNNILILGPTVGAIEFASTTKRSTTDQTEQAGAIYARHDNFLTTTNPNLSSAGSFDAHFQADTGVSSSGGAAVLFNAFRDQSSDMGTLSFLVGAFGGATQETTDSTATTGLLAGILSQVNVNSGTATTVADFYGLGGNLSGGTIGTQFGIYIAPANVDFKNNFLSGKATIGGTSFSSHNEVLKVNGDMTATISAVDSGANAATVTASSNTTVDGSNTTLGINGVASGTVQSGATNDKVVGGMNFAVTRGDNTDDGTLSAMTGANTLLFHNSGTAGVTTNVYGMSTIFFSQHGTATNLYDFFSQRVPAGDGVVTNHYGVYISNDNDSPVQNYLSGRTQIGGTSLSIAADASLELKATDKALLLNRVSSATETGLTAVNGMQLYNSDTNKFRAYENGAWVDMISAGGGGATTELDNLTTTAINASLIPDTDATYDLGTSGTAWNKVLAAFISGASGDNVLDTGNGFLLNANGETKVSFDSNNVEMKSGVSGGTDSGDAILRSLDAPSGASGIVNIRTGDTLNISGDVDLRTGDSQTNNSGSINLSAGTADLTRGSVNIDAAETNLVGFGKVGIGTGFTTTWGADLPGYVIDATQTEISNAGGGGLLYTGLGTLTILTDDQTSDVSAGIFIGTGGTASAAGTGGYILSTGNNTGVSGSSGSFSFQTGSSDNTNSGDFSFLAGAAPNGTQGSFIFSGSVASFSGATQGLLFPQLTADPTSPDDGTGWYRLDTDTLHFRINGVTKTVAFLP